MDAVTYAILNKTVGMILPGYTFKGSVADVGNLPSGATNGDMYLVDGIQYVWDGSQWTEIGVGDITNAQIDALFA